MKAALHFGLFWLSQIVLLAPPASPGAAPATRPNIVFILMDDQRWDDLGYAGHPFVKTPNIDRIATEGARFTHAYVTTPLPAK